MKRILLILSLLCAAPLAPGADQQISTLPLATAITPSDTLVGNVSNQTKRIPISLLLSPGAFTAVSPLSWNATTQTLTLTLATVATTGAYSDLTGRPTLGGAATLNVGTTTGTVAAGDDSRITGALTAATAASTYQPLNAGLTSIAALTTTTYGRSLLTGADAPTTRVTLGLGGAAVLSVGTTTGTVAAGDDARIIGAAQKSANLSDLASAATSRTNLGLAGAALLAVGTTMGTVAAGDDSRIIGAAQKSSNLSDVASAATSRTNLGLAIGTNVQAFSSTLSAVAGGTYTGASSITTTGTLTSGATGAGFTIGLGSSTLTGTVAIANGGTGTTTPGLVAGTNVTLTGSWPNQTVSAAGGASLGSISGVVSATSGTARAAISGDAVPLNIPDLQQPPRLWLQAVSCAAVGNGAAVANWGDSSGNGYTASQATGGKQPTYIASGINGRPVLRFAGAQGISTTSSCAVTANAHTGFMVLKWSAFTAGTQANAFDWSSGNHFMLGQAANAARSMLQWYDTNGTYGFAPMPLNVPIVFSWASTPAGLITRINGMAIYGQGTRLITALGPITGLTNTTINTANIGYHPVYGQYMTGDVAEVAIFNASLTPQEIAGVEAGLAAKYAIAIANNFAITKRFVGFGDSRSCNSNSGQSPPGSAIDSLRCSLGLGWFGINASISGTTSTQGLARVPTDAAAYYDASLSKNIAFVWYGINDLVAGTSATTIYSNLTAICSALKTAGFKVVLCTEIDGSSLTSPQQTQRAALNVSIAATSTSVADAICDLNAVMGSWNSTNWADALHPNYTGGGVIATALATTISGL